MKDLRNYVVLVRDLQPDLSRGRGRGARGKV